MPAGSCLAVGTGAGGTFRATTFGSSTGFDPYGNGTTGTIYEESANIAGFSKHTVSINIGDSAAPGREFGGD